MNMNGWLDSHCHILSEEFENDLPEVLKRAEETPLKRLLVICCTKEEMEAAPVFHKEHPDLVDIAAGYHPEDAAKWKEKDLMDLEKLLAENPFCALGEIGLDYHWTTETVEEQKELFIRQLEMADSLDLPVLIHMRDATEDTCRILKEHMPQRGGVMHCFPESYEWAESFLSLGFYISLGGPVTFKNGETSRDVAVNVPLNRLLIETDCPYMTPHPFRGKRNEPMYVRYTGEKIAELRGISEEELQMALWENYRRLFDRKAAEMP